MEAPRQLVVKALKEGGDVLGKLMKIIHEGSVHDPKGIVNDAVLYCFQERHDFRSVCHYVKEWQKWVWARGFLGRMERRLNIDPQEVDDSSILKRLMTLVDMYIAKEAERRVSSQQNKVTDFVSRINEVSRKPPPNLSKASSRFTFKLEATPQTEVPIITPIPEEKEEIKDNTQLPPVEKPKFVREIPANIDYVLEQRMRKNELINENILPENANRRHPDPPAKITFLPQLPEIPKVKLYESSNLKSPEKKGGAIGPKGASKLFVDQAEAQLPAQAYELLDLSFDTRSPIKKKKQPVVMVSSTKFANSVEEELSAMRPKNPYAYPQPDPNELYSERTKQQLRELYLLHQPYIPKKMSVWQRLNEDSKLSILPDVMESMENGELWKP